MRIVKYNSNSDVNCLAVCEIVIDEHELGVIDNALYEISKTKDCKKNKARCEPCLQQCPSLCGPSEAEEKDEELKRAAFPP